MKKRGIALGTALILLVLVAAGAEAKSVELSTHTNIVKEGSPATFFAGVKILVNEKFEVNYLTFSVFTKKGTIETCRFKADGTKIEGCDFVKEIVPIGKEDHRRYGYHYGAKKMLYKIVIKTDDLDPGDYKARLLANVSTKTKTKDFKSRVLSFKIVKDSHRVCPHKTR
jgi:hypothetical protein